MPVNPNIALMAQPEKAPTSPFDTLGDLMRIQSLATDQKLQKQRLEQNEWTLNKERREQQDLDDFRSEIQQHVGPDGKPDWLAASRSLLAKGNINAAGKAQDEHDKEIKMQDEAYSTRLKQVQMQAQTVNPLFRSALDAYDPKNPSSLMEAQRQWTLARSAAGDVFARDEPQPNGTVKKAPPAWLSQVPEQFDPTAAQQIVKFGVSLDDDIKLQNLALNKAKEAVALRKEGANADTAERESIGALLATAKSPEDWQKALSLGQSRGYKPEILDSFGPWSPDAPTKARQLAMSTDQWQTHLDRQTTEERERQNQANVNARMNTEQVLKVAGDAAGLDKWRSEQLLAIDRAAKQGMDPFTMATTPGLSAEEVATRRRDVEDTYRAAMARFKQPTGAELQAPSPVRTPTPGVGVFGTSPVQSVTPVDTSRTPATSASTPPAAVPNSPQKPEMLRSMTRTTRVQVTDPDARAAARAVLKKRGLPSGDSDIDRFFSSERNRKVFGLQ